MLKRKTFWTLWELDILVGVQKDDKVVSIPELFDDIKKLYVDEMQKIGFNSEVGLSAFKAVYHSLAMMYGKQDKSRVPRSMRMAYQQLCEDAGKAYLAEQGDKLEAIGWSLYEYPYVALPGALDVLTAIASEFNVAVVIEENEEEQQKKLFDSGLFVYVDQVVSVDLRFDEQWSEKIVHGLHIGPLVRKYSWVIGASVAQFVNRGWHLGFQCIELNYKEKNKDPYDTVEHITQLPDVLRFIFPPAITIQ